MSYEQQKAALVNYLMSCVYREDWHGVSDAANDLRELIAKHSWKAQL